MSRVLSQRLQAFPMMHELHSKSYRITVGANLTATDLRVNFKFEAAHPKEMAKVILPAPQSNPSRKPDLWKSTCFECFIPSQKSESYLEFNGSPSGDWNWYSFKKYREGQQEFKLNEESKPKQSVLTKSDTQIESEWVLPLIGIRQGFQSIGENHHDVTFIGMTMVVSTTIATLYWALKHDGVKPDFHLRSSFNYPIFTELK